MRNRNQSDGNSEKPVDGRRYFSLDVGSKSTTAPSFFRCPISLEVMRSPVSLCTGVTYDRSSIQRWFDYGNITCPATMQPLPSTDLVPNLTLHRLIRHWSEQYVPSLTDIARTLSDPTADDADKLCLVSSNALHPSALASLFMSHETLGLAVTLVSLSLDLVDANQKRELITSLLSNLDATVSGLVSVFKTADYSSSRVAAARVLEVLIAEETKGIARKPDLILELVKLIVESEATVVNAGMKCLMGLIEAGRGARAEMVRMGIVPALANVMERDGGEILAAAVERAMQVLGAVVECSEGRAAICVEAERCVAAMVEKMMKVGNEAKEAAVAVLWSLCCAGGGDRRARKAAAAAKGGLAKILVVMQGDCSPVVRKMAGDLIRVFRENVKSPMAAAGYESRTIHIMPY